MDESLYSTLKNTTDILASLQKMQFCIGNKISAIYGDTINTKKELAKYIYNNATISLDDNCIDETTKSYFKYFEDIYKDYQPFAPNAIGTSKEFEKFDGFPEIHSIYQKFAHYLCYYKFVYKDISSPNMKYNVPLGVVPILSALIRTLYSNKKLNNISEGQFLESISSELHKVIFERFPLIFGNDSAIGNPDNLRLLYRYCMGILYYLNTSYTYPYDFLMPCVPCMDTAYYNQMINFRNINYLSFFTHVVELYWKSIWKPLTEDCTYQSIKGHYFYETTPISLVLKDINTDRFITNQLSQKNSARFKMVNNTFYKIECHLQKHNTDANLQKSLGVINNLVEEYLQEIEKNNQNIIFPLVEQVYNKLERFALSQNDTICLEDIEKIQADYANAFHNIYGIYDMAALSIKYILCNPSLSDKDKFHLIKEQILPQLKLRDKTECYNRLHSEYTYFHHVLSIKNVIPMSHETDFQILIQLFQVFCNCPYMYEDDLCGKFDSLVKNVLSICPDKNNCFYYIFQTLTEDM